MAVRGIIPQIELPLCKSIAARRIMLDAYNGRLTKINDNFIPRDTEILLRAVRQSLYNQSATIDVDDNGTAMRFLIPFLASLQGKSFVLTGCRRMRQRPVGKLVEALRSMGADITYLEAEGFAPLKINGRRLDYRDVTISNPESSQFVSALMLLAAANDASFKVSIEGKSVSDSYIALTEECISRYSNPSDTLPRDWSSTSAFYEALTLMPIGSELLLKDLHTDGIGQPDMVNVEAYAPLGIETIDTPEGCIIRRCAEAQEFGYEAVDLASSPDMIPSYAVAVAIAEKKLTISKISHLCIKESDRLQAISEGIEKIGFGVVATNDSLSIIGTGELVREHIKIDTHNDHRIFMAFAPVAMLHPNIDIGDSHCCTKSFPSFSQQLEKLKDII